MSTVPENYALGDYILNWSSDSKEPIFLPVKRQDIASTSLRLTGRGSKNWGEILQENLLHIMEHFASEVEPTAPTNGQMWFKSTSDDTRGFYFYDDTQSGWVKLVDFGDVQSQVDALTTDVAAMRTRHANAVNQKNVAPVVDLVNRIIGTPTGKDVDEAFGWGQPRVDETVDGTIWSRIASALNRISVKTGVTIPSAQIPNDTWLVSASDTDAQESVLTRRSTELLDYLTTEIVPERFNVVPGQKVVYAPGATSASFNSFVRRRIVTHTLTFASVDAMYKYFNAGGVVRLNVPTLTGTVATSPRNYSWVKLLQAESSLEFGALPWGNIEAGFHQVAQSPLPVQIYKTSGAAGDELNPQGAGYTTGAGYGGSSSYYEITASVQGAVLTIKQMFRDGSGSAQPVDGTFGVSYALAYPVSGVALPSALQLPTIAAPSVSGELPVTERQFSAGNTNLSQVQTLLDGYGIGGTAASVLNVDDYNLDGGTYFVGVGTIGTKPTVPANLHVIRDVDAQGVVTNVTQQAFDANGVRLWVRNWNKVTNAWTSWSELAHKADIVNGNGTGQGSSTASPIGEVMFFARSTPPTGFMECNGAALSRTIYADLFAVIGTTYGAGDGSTTFNLPDLRGEFIRGWDNGRGVDTDRVFGSAQASQNLSHTHTGSTSSAGSHTHDLIEVTNNGGTIHSITGNATASATAILTNAVQSAGAHTHTMSLNTSGGSEARPRNIAMLPCIRVLPASTDATPVGSHLWHYSSTPPAGFLKANGAAVSRTVYANLFAVIGTTYGAGDGSTTFNLPDMRGEFIRGWDDNRGVDPARAFGSFQADEFKTHQHMFGTDDQIMLYGGYARLNSFSYDASSTGAGGGGGARTKNDTTNFGGTETRPRNRALLACIKY